MDFKRFSVAVLAALIMLPACVKVNGQLGENLIATDQQYDTDYREKTSTYYPDVTKPFQPSFCFFQTHFSLLKIL